MTGSRSVVPSVSRLLAVAVAAAALLGAFAPTAHTSCAAPETLVGSRHAAPGESLTVRGRSWGSECNDVITCSTGCGGETCTGGEPSPPVTGIRLVLRPVGEPSGGDRVLGEAIAANANLAFRVGASIPSYAAPGRYVIVAMSDVTGEVPSRMFRIG